MQSNRHPGPNQAGFSLIETIMVLGIAGLIIGGIWLGYSTATHMQRAAIGEQQIADILQTARNYMLQANENNCTAPNNYYGSCGTAGNDITQYLISNNLLPASITSTQNSNKLMVEYGTVTVLVYNSAANPYGSGPVIGVRINPAPPLGHMHPEDCTDIVSNWSSPDRVSESGIMSMTVDDNGLTITGNQGASNRLEAATITVTTSSTACSVYSWDHQPLNLFFRLNP